jgi:hypothetical protein
MPREPEESVAVVARQGTRRRHHPGAEAQLSYNCAICMDNMDVLESARSRAATCSTAARATSASTASTMASRSANNVLPGLPRDPTPRAAVEGAAAVGTSARTRTSVPAPSAEQEQPESSSGLEDTAPSDLEDLPVPRSSPVLEEPLLQPSQ